MRTNAKKRTQKKNYAQQQKRNTWKKKHTQEHTQGKTRGNALKNTRKEKREETHARREYAWKGYFRKWQKSYFRKVCKGNNWCAWFDSTKGKRNPAKISKTRMKKRWKREGYSRDSKTRRKKDACVGEGKKDAHVGEGKNARKKRCNKEGRVFWKPKKELHARLSV